MKTIHTTRKDPFIRQVIGTAFPAYKGDRITVHVDNCSGKNVNSYWDGGYRDYYSWLFFDVPNKTMIARQMGASHPYFDKCGEKTVPEGGFPPGVILVEHSLMGKSSAVQIYIHPDDISQLTIEEFDEELSLLEKQVLHLTRSLKPAFRSKYAKENGISELDWHTTKLGLIDKKLLNKNGAINPKGRNALGDTRGYDLGLKGVN